MCRSYDIISLFNTRRKLWLSALNVIFLTLIWFGVVDLLWSQPNSCKYKEMSQVPVLEEYWNEMYNSNYYDVSSL